MKKTVQALAIPLVALAMIGADFRGEERRSAAPVVSKRPCYGYVIIEFGKGIDCNGDTVRLVKVNGGQERVKMEE